MQNLQILIVFVVKICKQCLQTISVSPHWGTCVPRPPELQTPNKNSWCRHLTSMQTYTQNTQCTKKSHTSVHNRVFYIQHDHRLSRHTLSPPKHTASIQTYQYCNQNSHLGLTDDLDINSDALVNVENRCRALVSTFQL